MKKFLLIYVILTSYTFGQSLLHCLGKEEAHYAKLKYTGPNYKLNQIMIEEISALSDLEILPAAYRRICRDPKAYPSLLLLETLMRRQTKLFKSSENMKFQHSTFQSIREKSGRLLINYLSYIQSVAPTAKCVENKIPGVKILYSRYHYLQDVVDEKDLNGSMQELKKIFAKLKNVDGLLNSCKQKRAKKTKNRKL